MSHPLLHYSFRENFQRKLIYLRKSYILVYISYFDSKFLSPTISLELNFHEKTDELEIPINQTCTSCICDRL